MLHRLKKFGSGARAVVGLATSALPLAIIGGLLYAGFFVKAEAVIGNVEPKAVERRDNFFGVASPAADIVWAAGSSGKIVRSNDGGKSWARQQVPTRMNLQGIAAWDEQRAVAVGNQGVIVFTGDGGNSWNAAKTPESANPNKLFRVRIHEGVAWAVGEFGALLQSKDFGATWTRSLPEKDRAWNNVFFRGQQGWIVGEFGVVMRSLDGGATWAEVATPNKVSLTALAFRDDQNGVAVGLTGTALKTSDGGATWVPVAKVTKEHLFDVIWDDGRWVAVGDKGVIVTSNDAASDWKAARISEKDVSWRTQIEKRGTRHYLAGANLAILEDGKLTVVGRPTM